MTILTRDQHLFGPGPKRILALDGGGVRGLISLGILSAIEKLLAERSGRGDQFRLADYFDLIAGTSTGSIIATALALGMTVERVKAMYDKMCPILFPRTEVKGVLKFRRDARKLDAVLSEQIGERTLASGDVRTGLMVCAKRIDTDSAWVLTNNPRGKFWDATDGSYTPNKDYPLKTIVRASAAAPTFFEPVVMTITEKTPRGFPEQPGAFVDGAISGHNSPALQALMTALLPSYKFNWKRGQDNLLLISVGTGMRRNRFTVDEFVRKAPADQAVEALKGLINATVKHNLALLQALSEPNRPWPIDAEIEGLEGELLTSEPLMRFQRYDTSLERGPVIEALGLATQKQAKQTEVLRGLESMDNGSADNAGHCYALGVVAGRSVSAADFPSAFDPPS